MEQFDNIYRNKRVLITGNTGFKGSWLALWLQELGANVIGLSNQDFDNDTHFKGLKLDYKTYYVDINHTEDVETTIEVVRPDIIFHLAAQSLVRESYTNPVLTYKTNIIGTLNVFEAARKSDSVIAVVNVTTDKVYENQEKDYSYKENDRLGGVDLYSSSKACSEILTSSYKRAYSSEMTQKKYMASARAGNVIGGGDYSKDRLIPDIIKASVRNESTSIRNPKAIRPWQHVLEPLSGYLLLGQKLLEKNIDYSSEYNFGPEDQSCIDVGTMAKKIQSRWDKVLLDIENEIDDVFHEAGLLKLDSTKSKNELSWLPVWDLDETLEKTINWYKNYEDDGQLNSVEDLHSYIDKARSLKLIWCS